MSQTTQGGGQGPSVATHALRLAPYLALGPVTGPFLAGVVHNVRDGRPVLASMYAFLLASWWLLLPMATVRIL
jgi:hypothetical protein